jgi:hypothetical protein
MMTCKGYERNLIEVIMQEVLRKITEKSEKNRYPDEDWNQEPPKQKCRDLPPEKPDQCK